MYLQQVEEGEGKAALAGYAQFAADDIMKYVV